MVQSPSNARISYLNEHAIADVMRFPETKMWNLPITHNKSSNRWKNVRHPSHACVQQRLSCRQPAALPAICAAISYTWLCLQ